MYKLIQKGHWKWFQIYKYPTERFIGGRTPLKLQIHEEKTLLKFQVSQIFMKFKKHV